MALLVFGLACLIDPLNGLLVYSYRLGLAYIQRYYKGAVFCPYEAIDSLISYEDISANHFYNQLNGQRRQ